MVSQLRQRLEQEKGRFSQVVNDLDSATRMLDKLGGDRNDIDQAQVIIQNVASQTQQQLSWYINDMVSMAIDSIYPDENYNFLLEFTQRRGRTEADIFLSDKVGHKIKPSDAEGGGLVNVVAFILRVALWSLTKSSRPTFILDEPMHFLHGRENHERISELLKAISERLGLQIIMITGEDESEEIVAGANRVFRVTKQGWVSHVKQEL